MMGRPLTWLRPRGSRGRSRQGLTLIEVLLAVSILGFGLTVMLTAISRCLAVFKLAKDYHIAQGVRSEGELENPLVLVKQDPDAEPDDFEVSPERYREEYTFSRTTEDPFDDGENEDGRLVIVKTLVEWGGGGRNNSEEVAQYIYYREKE